jgi:tight adherence protein B
MSLRRRIPFLVSLIALVAAPAAAAAADGGIGLVGVRSKFPERSFILTFPRDVALERTALRVYENGEPIDRVALTPANAVVGARIGTVLVVDASDSMEGQPIMGAVAAARAFVAQRNPDQALAIVTFNSRSQVRLPFTTNSGRINSALATVPELERGTNLYDAVEKALGLISNARRTRASIVVLSDGADTGSAASLAAVTARARAARVRLFTVGLASKQFDPETLQMMASETRGTYAQASSPADLERIFDSLGYRLANEYLLQYKSFAGPNERVRVTVTVAGIEGAGRAAYRSPKLAVPPPPAFTPSAVDKVIQSPLTMLLLAALVAALFGLAASSMIKPRSSGVRKRLGAFVAVADPAAAKRQTSALSEKVLSGTERSLQKTRWWTAFKQELEIGEIRLPAEQIVVLTVLGTLVAAWLLMIFAGTIFVVVAIAVPLLVRAFVRLRAERQRRAFADQLPDNLQVLSSALRAGHSLIGALSVVVDDAPEPSRREFRRVVNDEQLGVPLETAITSVAARMRNRDLEQVALVAGLQRETGGNSAEVLDRVAETVRERAALRRLVRTLTAQGRMARWIVSAIPVLLVVIISFLNPEYMKPLFSRTAGQILLVLASLMVISGSLVIKKIINIKV